MALTQWTAIGMAVETPIIMIVGIAFLTRFYGKNKSGANAFLSFHSSSSLPLFSMYSSCSSLSS